MVEKRISQKGKGKEKSSSPVDNWEKGFERQKERRASKAARKTSLLGGKSEKKRIREKLVKW